jgi:hypothetical protein
MFSLLSWRELIFLNDSFAIVAVGVFTSAEVRMLFLAVFYIYP